MEIEERKLRSLLREAFIEGFDSSGASYNGEFMHDGMGDPDAPKREAGKFATKRVLRLKKRKE